MASSIERTPAAGRSTRLDSGPGLPRESHTAGHIISVMEYDPLPEPGPTADETPAPAKPSPATPAASRPQQPTDRRPKRTRRLKVLLAYPLLTAVVEKEKKAFVAFVESVKYPNAD